MQTNKIGRELLLWYSDNKRMLPFRRTSDPYKIWLSEVMLQQTKVNTVVPYYNRWLKHYPTLQSAADATTDQLLKLWEGLGYYQRCSNFHKALKIVVNNYKGKIPSRFDHFINLPGVGEYTAGAVLSIAFNKPIPAIDGNVKRVMSRILGIKNLTLHNKNRIEKTIYKIIPKGNPGDFNQALMELGALLCTPQRPICTKCPITNYCNAYKLSKPELYPLPKEPKKLPHYIIVTGIIWRESKFYIQKRNEKSMLGGLWEFPGGKVENKESLERALKREIKEECGIIPIIKEKIGCVEHSYSHFSISLNCFHCIESDKKIRFSKNGAWITNKEIASYPFPRANHKLFSLINKKGWNV